MHDHINDYGYDFYIAACLPDHMRKGIEKDCILGKEDAKRFGMIEIPKTTYAVFETNRTKFSTLLHLDFRKKTITEWLPSSGYN